MAKIVPGILTTSQEQYTEKLKKAEHVCDFIQIDVVDGKFSKNETVGVDVIKKNPTSALLEVQLMVVEPLGYVKDLAGVDFVSRIIFPLEIGEDIREIIYAIKKLDKQAGLSLNPQTPVEEALRYFDDLDLLLLMTGNPGYSGQKLGESVYNRIKIAKTLDQNLPIEIDIGVNFENAAKLARAGANFLVTSSTLFNSPNMLDAYERLARLAKVNNN